MSRSLSGSPPITSLPPPRESMSDDIALPSPLSSTRRSTSETSALNVSLESPAPSTPSSPSVRIATEPTQQSKALTKSISVPAALVANGSRPPLPRPGSLTPSVSSMQSSTTASSSSLSFPSTSALTTSSHQLTSSNSSPLGLSATLASLSSTVSSIFRSPSASSASIVYFSYEQIARHNTADDFWTIVNGRVYDLTDYLNLHPGGFRLLFKNGGLDSTDDFIALHHSKKAVAILDAYWIGDVIGSRHRFAPVNGGSALTEKRQAKLGDALKIAASVSATVGKNYMPPPKPKVQQRKDSNTDSGTRVEPAVEQLVKTDQFTIQLVPPTATATAEPAAIIDTPALKAAVNTNKPRRFVVVSNEGLSSDTQLVELRLVTNSALLDDDYTSEPLTQFHSGHITIQWPSDSGSVKRQYTPIRSTATTLTLMVKLYHRNQSSTTRHWHAQSLPVHTALTVYGPYHTLPRSIDHCSAIVMIAHGSGLTPMYQIIDYVSRTRGKQSLWLLYGAADVGSIWLRSELTAMVRKRADCRDTPFHIRFQLSSGAGDCDNVDDSTSGSGCEYHSGRISAAMIRAFVPVNLPASSLYCVCGTDSFTASVSDVLQHELHIPAINIHIF